MLGKHASGTYQMEMDNLELTWMLARRVLAMLRDFGLDRYIANNNVQGVAKD
jgi:hypothetical protein